MASKKYLTEEKFDKFLGNDFKHLDEDVHFIKGGMKIIIPLVLSFLGLVGVLIKLVFEVIQ